LPQAHLPRSVCWSNGNVFRALTLLAVSYCEQHGVPFGAEALTPALLEQLMQCLKFGKFNGEFDIRIQGQGFDLLVSQVANTVLKEPRVGKNIPTVAKMTQGEVRPPPARLAASAFVRTPPPPLPRPCQSAQPSRRRPPRLIVCVPLRNR